MLVWEKNRGGHHYQVRRAGHSLRLYRNGVFHSQYNGQRLLNGGVWDMLWLPLWFRPARQRQRILLLGVGAGAAARKILDAGFTGHMVGVELDPVHLQVARQQVGLRSRQATIELHRADAFEWLKRYRGPAFDIIIDDVYVEREGQPERALGGGFSEASWYACQQKRLRAGGLLLANCDGRRSLASLADTVAASGRTSHAVQFSVPQYQNRIALFSSEPLAREHYWQNLEHQFGASAVRQIRRAGVIPRRLNTDRRKRAR